MVRMLGYIWGDGLMNENINSTYTHTTQLIGNMGSSFHLTLLLTGHGCLYKFEIVNNTSYVYCAIRGTGCYTVYLCT